MANNELSTEMRKLNKKFNNSICEIMAKVVMDPDIEVDMNFVNPALEMYKTCFGYMELFAKFTEKYELFDAWMEENNINLHSNPHESVEDFKTWYITKVWAA